MKQQYDKYTAQDHEVWSILFNRQKGVLETRATREFLEGIGKIGFEPDKIPRFTEVNELLGKLTGWQVYEVPGIVADDVFFALMAEKKFPATTWIRTMEELDYLEEPDMFHDVYGHLPLLVNQHFCDFLQGISQIAVKHIDDPWAIELMSRLYWFTIEFGLIKEKGERKIYGAGILSSAGESVYSLESDIPQQAHFDILEMFDTPYIKEKYQVKYFAIESYKELYNSLPLIEPLLEEALSKVKKAS